MMAVWGIGKPSGRRKQGHHGVPIRQATDHRRFGERRDPRQRWKPGLERSRQQEQERAEGEQRGRGELDAAKRTNLQRLVRCDRPRPRSGMTRGAVHHAPGGGSSCERKFSTVLAVLSGWVTTKRWPSSISSRREFGISRASSLALKAGTSGSSVPARISVG